MTARKTTTTKAATAKAAPSKRTKAATPKAATPTAARTVLGSFDASKADMHKCEGACGQRLPVKKFPTVTGTTRRVAECRSCRDARTKAAKEAKA